MAKVPVGQKGSHLKSRAGAWRAGGMGILIGITTTAGGVIVPIKMARQNAKLEDFVRI
jgi:hypothetical protein